MFYTDIEDLPRHLQRQLFEEILDTDVEKGNSNNFKTTKINVVLTHNSVGLKMSSRIDNRMNYIIHNICAAAQCIFKMFKQNSYLIL